MGYQNAQVKPIDATVQDRYAYEANTHGFVIESTDPATGVSYQFHLIFYAGAPQTNHIANAPNGSLFVNITGADGSRFYTKGGTSAAIGGTDGSFALE